MIRDLLQTAALQVLPKVRSADGNSRDFVARLRSQMSCAHVREEASRWVAVANGEGFKTDWVESSKPLDFGTVLAAARSLLPIRGSLETGVFRGGTSAVIMQALEPGAVHVSIDPFGRAGQSYDLAEYRDSDAAESTVAHLRAFAQKHNVDHRHFWIDSVTFTVRDLLPKSAPISIVHLDGDHGYSSVAAELRYFLKRLQTPVLYILDDHDEHFPGVEVAMRLHGRRLIPVLHNFYQLPGYGQAGFSVWLDY